MTPEEREVLKRAFQRKRNKKIAPMVTPLAPTTGTIDSSTAPPLVLIDLPPAVASLAPMTGTVNSPAALPRVLVDLPITPPPVPASIKEEVAPSVAQAPSPLNGGTTHPKKFQWR